MFELRQLTVDYGHVHALGPVDATFGAGGLTAVMGPNGSGKTTLLKVVAGLVKPSAGKIHRPATTSVAYVAQHHLQHRWMPLTVGEVMKMSQFGSRPFPWPLSRDQKRRVADASERLGVEDLSRRTFGELSGGQKQRVLIASAIATQAPVVLLDEPITGLDIPSQQRIVDVITQERDAGKVVLISTHHLDEAQRCDRVILLNRTIVADGAPDAVLTAEHLATTFGPRVLNTSTDEPLLVDDHGHGSHTH